jgi:hypothetical protein
MKETFNIQEAMELIPDNKKSILLYFNVRGWQSSYSKEPYVSTPTGKLWKEGFPRVVRVFSNGKVQNTKLKEI